MHPLAGCGSLEAPEWESESGASSDESAAGVDVRFKGIAISLEALFGEAELYTKCNQLGIPTTIRCMLPVKYLGGGKKTRFHLSFFRSQRNNPLARVARHRR